MDLVSSYSSEHGEDSEIEEIETSRKKACNINTMVDVIDLDSDSANETSTQTDGKKVSSQNSKNNNCTNSNKKFVNCFDANVKNIKPNDVLTLPSESPTTVSDSTGKVDYMNLETSDSDTDTELEHNENKIDTLIHAAAVLNDVPCGPIKSSEIQSQLLKRSIDNDISSDRSTPNSILGSSTNVDNDTCISGDSKRYRSDASEIKLFKGEKLKSESDLDSCLLKEDERVLEANQKNVCRIPKNIIQTNKAHSNVIMSLNWCIPQYSHLYLSASLDSTIKIWDLFHKNPVQCISVMGGLSAAKWSLDGGQVCAGGIGKKAFVFDVQTGKQIIEYEIYNYVNSIEVHPYMEDVFLCGTNNAILGFDLRVNTKFPIRTFLSNCKEVLDMTFLDENEFVCSTNIVSHDSADRTIMVWDFSSGAILSNQIFLERYTCPSLKVHPTDSSFVAQTNGNYIATFSTARPYKIKNKRYMGHKVSGYAIECDISPDGKYLVSGDADGGVYYYHYGTSASAHKAMVKQNSPTSKLKWHPTFSSTIITANDCQIQLWK